MKTPWAELRVIPQLVKTCPLPHFSRLHVHSPYLHMPLPLSLAIRWPHPRFISHLPPLPRLRLQKHSVTSENGIYHSCQMLSSTPPFSLLLQNSHSGMLLSPSTLSLPSITSPLSLIRPSRLCEALPSTCLFSRPSWTFFDTSAGFPRLLFLLQPTRPEITLVTVRDFWGSGQGCTPILQRWCHSKQTASHQWTQAPLHAPWIHCVS